MANDRPTNLRMGFGFQQARAAGAPYERPPTEKEMNYHLRVVAAENELRKIVSEHSAIGECLRENIKNFIFEKYSSLDLLFQAQCMLAASAYRFVVFPSFGSPYKSRKVVNIYRHDLEIIVDEKPIMLSRYSIKSIRIYRSRFTRTPLILNL